jgi:uncharacterized repeat protein (TIGR01451 family)
MNIFKLLIINFKKASVGQSTGMQCQNERVKLSPAIIRLISQLGLLGLLWIMTEVVIANQIPTTPSGTWSGTGTTTAATKDTPSGLRTTVSIGGSGMTIGTRNNTSLQKSSTVTVPNLPSATNGIEVFATANSSCVNTSLNCNNLGTVTFDFTDAAGNPIKVENPVIHMSRLGEKTGNTYLGAVLSLTIPASGASLGIASGARGFSVAGNKISPDLSSFPTSSTSIGVCSTSSGTPRAGCGSIPVTGLVSSLSFNVDLVRNNSLTNWQNASGVGAADGFYFTVSFDEDYGDARASFDSTTAASHIVSDLTLGATIDADNTGVSNGGETGTTSVTPSPNAVAAGANNNGTNGDGADEDAISTFPALTTSSTSYALTVPISGASRAGQVCGWIDLNRNNIFDNLTAERACTSFASAATSVVLNWSGLSGLTVGNNYVRLRASYDTMGVQNPTGRLNSGEVEDYRIAIANTANPVLSTDFCQASASSRNLLFILDDSSSVDTTELQTQRQAVMDTLNDFVAKNLTGQAAMVGFDSVGRTVIDYTNITAANLATFQTALNSNYGVPGNGTHWDKGFQAGIALGVDKPDVLFFFTDGTNNSGASPDDEANQFKNAGAHIYGIGVQGLTVENGFRGITDGDDTVVYSGSNLLEADFLQITQYSNLQAQYTNAFLANLCPADFGDAPDTYGTNNIANNSSNTSEPLGANHRIVSGLNFGATAPDIDANGFVDGIENNTNATDDDVSVGTGTGNGNDEGNFTFPILNEGKKNYTIPMSNITVTNTDNQPATLHAWIDFNKNGKFDPTEYASVSVAQGTNGGNPTANLTWSDINVGTVGDTYARFRLTKDSLINNTTPGGAASSGEVEDYQIAIAQASDPNLLLVKRITAINPGQPGEIQFNNFDNDADDNSDNNSQWPDSNSNHNDNVNAYLRGVTNSSAVKPGDEVEYTIYFLSTGDINAKSVNICDAVPDHMTFVKNTYGVELGIGLGFDSTTIPLTPNLKLSNLLNDDQGDFYAPNTTPPANLCKKVSPANTLVNVNGANNDNGAIVIKIQDLPKADTPGSPTNSYGFLRFRTKVK